MSASEATPALAVAGVRKAYGSVQALAGVSFDVAPGSVTGLLGPNGAGKSTLMQCVTTLLRPDAGAIRIFGTDAAADPRGARDLLGYVPQTLALDKVLTGREHLELHGALYHVPRGRMREAIGEALTLVGLADVADRRVGTYSGGMARRLDLAAALLHRPRLLVLDEPTVGLDIQSRSAIWKFVRALADGGTAVLIASHHTEEIEFLSDRVAILDHGAVRAEGTPDDLKARFGSALVHLKLREFAAPEELESAAGTLRQSNRYARVLVDTRDGGRITVVLAERPESPEAVRRELAGLLSVGDEGFFAFALERPTLEDVFLDATGHALRDAAWTSAEGDPIGRRRPA